MDKDTRQFEDDDGRVICNMDVEGMPWHTRRVRREKRGMDVSRISQSAQMTKSEARRFTWNAVLAALTVGLIFSTVWILLTLFMTQIWFR
jgi:hypothetical protein